MTEYGTDKHGYADLKGNQRLPFYHVRNPNFRAYLAEFVGTFILVLIGDGSVAQYVLGGGGAGHYLSVNLCWGIALLFGIHFSGGVSGGHLNPAVTLTLALFKRFEWHKVPGYFLTAGAFAAAMIVFIVYYPWFDIQDPQRETTQGIFATYPNAQIPNWSALANEIIGTALLVSGIFAVADQLNKPASPYSFPGAVALMLTCIGYALNLARDFGPRLFTFFAGWDGRSGLCVMATSGSPLLAHLSVVFLELPRTSVSLRRITRLSKVKNVREAPDGWCIIFQS